MQFLILIIVTLHLKATQESNLHEELEKTLGSIFLQNLFTFQQISTINSSEVLLNNGIIGDEKKNLQITNVKNIKVTMLLYM